MGDQSKFEFIFSIGKQACSACTGFSKTEIRYCRQRRNWAWLAEFLDADGPYEALISFSLKPAPGVVGYFQLFTGCMVQAPGEKENPRLANLLRIIDTRAEFDEALTNARMMRALLALGAKYDRSSPGKRFSLFLNAKRVLAHAFRKYPKYLDLNILRAKRKGGSPRFKPEEIDAFW